jgi:5-oxoprolinase (ATP-hydrolysing) subunit A
MAIKVIDINSDLGEGFGNDAVIMPYISSCNIACGGHFGSPETVKATIDLAIQNQVKIGAHPSYPDEKNFGRRKMDISQDELEISLLNQIQLVEKEALKKNQILHHIKLHGALYLDTIKDIEKANLVANLVRRHFPESVIYAPFKSKMAAAARNVKLEVKYEVFADRNYLPDLSLVNRNDPQAILIDPIQINEHLLLIIENQKVKTMEGKAVNIKGETICVHGDNAKAMAIAKSIHEMFLKKGYLIQ